jgi:hypothetical protein
VGSTEQINLNSYRSFFRPTRLDLLVFIIAGAICLILSRIGLWNGAPWGCCLEGPSISTWPVNERIALFLRLIVPSSVITAATAVFLFRMFRREVRSISFPYLGLVDAYGHAALSWPLLLILPIAIPTLDKIVCITASVSGLLIPFASFTVKAKNAPQNTGNIIAMPFAFISWLFYMYYYLFFIRMIGA